MFIILQALNAELLQLRSDADKKETKLELQLKELTNRVESYEKVESELDQVILQAAEGMYEYNRVNYQMLL